MRALLIAAAVAGVAALFWLIFAISDGLRRAARRRVRDVSRIEPGRHGRRETIETSLDPIQAIDRVAKAFATRATVTHRTDREIILFRGRGGGALQFGGISFARPEEMPLLVAARAEPGRVEVTIANDFGWNLFAGPARVSYLELVGEAVAGAVASIRTALGA